MRRHNRFRNGSIRYTSRSTPSSLQLFKALPEEQRPDFHIGFTPGKREFGEYSTRFRIRRVWPVIIVLCFILVAFSAPLVNMGNMEVDRIDDLFDLTFFLFTWFWRIGWSVGLVILFLALLGMLFPAEKLIVRRHVVILRLECLGFGVGASYLARHMSNLRTEEGKAEEGTAWRGRHLVFDYHHVPVRFGVHLDGEQVLRLTRTLQQTLQAGIPVREIQVADGAGAREPGPDVAREEEARELEQIGKSRTSSLFLVLANLVPVAGVLWFDWQIGEIMLLFWIESAIIGLFNVLKMIVVARWAATFMVPFFMAHYGGFMAGHLLFIFSFFLNSGEAGLSDVAAIFVSLWPAIASLFVSHGFSFLHNFLGRGEYRHRTMKQQMHEPYKRIIIMHVTIILGGFIVMALNAPLGALVLLIALKVAVDLGAHLKSHRRAGRSRGEANGTTISAQP